MEILGENIYIQIAKGIIFGLLLGLIPFFIAKKRGFTEIGIWAIILCCLASSILNPVTAIPIAAIFTMVASLKEHEKIKD